MTNTSKYNEQEKDEIVEKWMAQRERHNNSMRGVMKNYYQRNFKISDSDDEQVKIDKQKKIEERKIKRKALYNSGERAEKQRQRMRDYRAKKKAEKLKQQQEQADAETLNLEVPVDEKKEHIAEQQKKDELKQIKKKIRILKDSGEATTTTIIKNSS